MKAFSLSVVMVALAIVGMPLAALESANAASDQKVFEFKNFTGIDASGGVQIVLTQDKKFSVRASGDKEALDSLDIRTRGRTLRVGFRPHFGTVWNSPIQVEIAMPELTNLRLSGASSIKIHFDARQSPRVVFDISGGATLEGLLIASMISGEVNGGSILKIEGYAESAIVQVNGGGRMECVDFAVDTATFALSGGAYACLAVQSTIVVKGSGGSRLEYRGKPEVRQKLSGGASVSQVK